VIERKELRKIKKELNKRGWLLEADSKLPSIVTLVVGKPVKGSWWGHAKGNLIYNTCGLLDDENDVLCLKLINGKRTYVHRRYWNLISNLVQSNRTYLEKSLSSESRKILKTVEKNGSLRSDRSGAKTYSLIKPFVKELEKSLLCCSQSIHTESGFHITELVSWAAVFHKRKFPPKLLSEAEVQQQTLDFKGSFAKTVNFPWD
jgi:hypothetical protein